MKNFASPAFCSRPQTVRKQAQRGITTVQVAIGILVSVIALVGSFAGFQYVQQAKVNIDVAAMADLKAATMRYGSLLGSTGFTTTNLTITQLIRMGFFASSAFRVVGTSAVYNQYTGQVAVIPATDLTTNSEGLTIIYDTYSSSACRDVAMRIDNLAAVIRIIDGKNTVTMVKPLNGTLDPVKVISACGTGSSAQLRVTFTRT